MATDLQEMRENRGQLHDQAKAIVQQARDEGRDLSDNESQQVDELMDQVEALGVDIERIERFESTDAAMDQPARKVPYPKPGNARKSHFSTTNGGAGAIGASARELFGQALDRGGFDKFSDFAKGVHSGLSDNRLIPAVQAQSHTGGVGTDGGFMIPPAYLADLLDASIESEIVRPRARTVPLQFGHARAAGFDVSDQSGSIGGFSAEWLGEGEVMTRQKGLLRSIHLQARKLGILTTASNELIADSPFFENDLRDILVRAMGFSFDEAFLTGSGNGQPVGVLNDPALVAVAKEQGQAADTITFNNLKAMLNRLHPSSMQRAEWVASTTTREQLLSLVQYIRNADDTENVGGSWVPAMREDAQGQWRILGLPVRFTDKLPKLGDKGDILLCDFSEYVVAISSEATFRADESRYFDTDEMAFRVTMRADGMGRWNGPMKPRHGGSTLSWAVALAKRS